LPKKVVEKGVLWLGKRVDKRRKRKNVLKRELKRGNSEEERAGKKKKKKRRGQSVGEGKTPKGGIE